MVTHGDHLVRPEKGAPYQPSDQRKTGEEIDVGPSCGDHNRFPQDPAQMHRREPVGVDIMTVNEIELVLPFDPSHLRQHR